MRKVGVLLSGLLLSASINAASAETDGNVYLGLVLVRLRWIVSV